ncbi:MAG: hypothetical protein IPG01_09645 [Chitinophagaceae bacterium]|nr:hypothetical protein [Chitinophagaceae bacterium]
MFYNIYKNITEKEYYALKVELNKFQEVVNKYLEQFSFYPQRKKYPEALNFDFEKYDDNFLGGIGFSYDDLPGKLTFTLNLIKAYDTPNGRYYHSETVVKSFEAKDLWKNYEQWFKKAVDNYNSISKEDLTDYTEFTKIS